VSDTGDVAVCVLLTDEFYEAVESQSSTADAAATAESPLDAHVTANDLLSRVDGVMVDDHQLSVPNDSSTVSDGSSITVDSDAGLLQPHSNAADDSANAADNTADAATDTGAQTVNDSVTTVSVEEDIVLQTADDSQQVVIESNCQVNSAVPTDNVSNDELAGSSLPPPTDGVLMDGKTESHQLDTAGDHGNNHSHSNDVVDTENGLSPECASCDHLQPTDDNVELCQLDTANDNDDSRPENKEAMDSDFVDNGQPADDTDQTELCDSTTAGNGEDTIDTLLPLNVAEEPSTADSNDDSVEFVEASTSLNADGTGEQCAVMPMTSDLETETYIDAEQQQQDDDDNKDEEFVDSSSEVSPLQPAEGMATVSGSVKG